MYEDQNRGSAPNTETLLREQLEVMRKQLRLSRFVSAMVGIAAAALIAFVVLVTPQTFRALNRANSLLKELDDTGVTELIQDMDELAKSSRKDMDSVGQVMDKLNQLDLEGLNKAIENLESTTRPLADLFGRSN